MTLIDEYLKDMKRLSKRGRCLHFDAGDRCNQIINAHSIQKSGQLKEITEDGHVIRLYSSISSLRKNNDRLSGESIGWKQVSTFAGFCKNHDNSLFKPIDDPPLHPTHEQVFLYSYRCLCREYFVKENAVDLSSTFRKHHDKTSTSLRNYLESMEKGHSLGFKNLKEHKIQFDKSLSNKKYSDINYIIFTSINKWNVQLSGVTYPDFDFNGNHLQNICDPRFTPQLVAYFTAPMKDGWAFVFAWHESSREVGKKLLSSLIKHCNEGTSPADAILRFTFSCCENHALRPSWWHSLSELSRSSIIDRASLMANPIIPVPPNYLAFGLEGIADWNFKIHT